MSHSNVLEQGAVEPAATPPSHRRKIVNAVWAPFLQFKLLMYMLGTTAIVAVLLGAFLYVAFSDMISVMAGSNESTSYYGEMIEIQLVHLFRYCGALFVLYILLLAAVCVAYTHRLVGPLRPFTRHVDALSRGDYASRVRLRKSDLELYDDYAAKLNALAVHLETKDKHG